MQRADARTRRWRWTWRTFELLAGELSPDLSTRARLEVSATRRCARSRTTFSMIFFISPEIFLLDFVHFFTIAHAGVVVKSPYEPRKVLSLFSLEDIYRSVPTRKYPVTCRPRKRPTECVHRFRLVPSSLPGVRTREMTHTGPPPSVSSSSACRVNADACRARPAGSSARRAAISSRRQSSFDRGPFEGRCVEGRSLPRAVTRSRYRRG